MPDKPKLRGLYISLNDGLHTYGLQAINDEEIYDLLAGVFCNHPLHRKWFRQGDSNHRRNGDKSWLFIEFLGLDLNDDTALALCEEIAESMGCELKAM